MNFYHDILMKDKNFFVKCHQVSTANRHNTEDLFNSLAEVAAHNKHIKQINHPLLYMVCAGYYINQKYVYKISKDFGGLLKDVKLNLNAKTLDTWQDGSYIIDLPFPFKTYMGNYVWHIFGTVYRKKDALELMFAAPHYNEHGHRLDEIDVLLFPFYYNRNETLQEQIEKYEQIYNEKTKEHNTVSLVPGLIKYVINCLLYINSGDPDLRHLKVKPPHKSRDGKWYAKRELTFAASPTVLVGFNWKKANVRYADETVVKAHPRWQPCGKNRENVKLILVKEHVRKFNNKEPKI